MVLLTQGEKLCSQFSKQLSSRPHAGPIVKAVCLGILSGFDSLKGFWGSTARGNS